MAYCNFVIENNLFYINRRATDDLPDFNVSEEKFQQVRSVIKTLSHKYRQPIVLRYLYDFEISQISQMLGVSVNVVNTRLSRAREKLKTSLSKTVDQ